VGVKVKPVKFLDYMEFFSEEKERGFGYSVSMAFLCDYVSGDLRPDDNAAEVRVFQELPENIIAEQREMLEKYWNELEITK
jgi:ADP-ribose pyrophosphatase YjhB (NUDIX family)